tara:strand:+ start:1367 stop:2062 length:696 start_codon:yes stop_codon:yes gene_type:complete
MVLDYLFKLVGMSSSNRYGKDWSKTDVFYSLLNVCIKYLRGLSTKYFFKRSGRFILRGKGVKLLFKSYVSVGEAFVLEDFCEINGKSLNGLMFGNNVTIGKYALIRPSNEYGGASGEGLKVGDNSNIGPYSYIGCSGYIEIGNNVMMGPRVSIYAENHVFDSISETMKSQGITRSGVIINDDCWLASNVVILAGVEVGKGAIIAAGSVVTKSVPEYSIVAGNPAKVIKFRS